MAINEQQIGEEHPGVFELDNNRVILFAGWTTGTKSGLVAAVLLSMAVAALFEGLLEFRYIQRLSMTVHVKKFTDCRPRMISYPRHLIQTALHVCQVILAYFLMLSVMTFNVWVLLGIAVGSGIGHFLARPVVDYMFSKTEDRQTYVKVARRWHRSQDCDFEESISLHSEDKQKNAPVDMVMYVTTV